MLGNETVVSDPRNHSVPILDIFQDEEDETLAYMVMPLLRPIDDPPFETVDDVVNLVDQISEVCLIFMPRSLRPDHA